MALASLAFALRIGCAAVTEIDPIFPAYYYTDATMIHGYALNALADLRAGRPLAINGSIGERVQTLISLEVYRTIGVHPFAIKALNAILGALAVAAFAWAMSLVFPARPAVIAGLSLAVWPSHIFYTSQNLKEAPIALLAYAALGAALAGGFGEGVPRSRAAALAAGAGLALMGAGFYRSYVMVCLAAALVLALGLSAFRRAKANALVTAAILILVPALYPSVADGLLSSFKSRDLSASDQGRIAPYLIPVAYSADSMSITRPTSPEGISRFRHSRQSADRQWAESIAHREIGTQIYPDETFESWLDILFYLPKGSFTILFMPLPGLHPMDGKVGRWAAAGENSLLLLLALFAAAGFFRGAKTPERLGMIAFFAAMTAGGALLEFDLGSSGRHKLLYLPFLFPFAAEEALRLFRLEGSE